MHAPKAEFSSSGSGYTLPSYAFETPPELSVAGACDAPTYPVVIVGAGLAGLTLGVDLLLRGVPVVLIDEDNTVGVRGASSRGICYAQKSLETFDRLGIYQRIAAKGVQWQVGRTLDGDEEVYRFDLRDAPQANASVQPAFINIQQYYVELFLVERFLELCPTVAGSSLRWHTRVLSCSQTPDCAALNLTTPQGEYHLRALWLADASGVHSAIRNGFDLPINAIKGEDRWCISDVRFKTEPAAERWTWIQAPFNDNRAVWQHLMADGVWRLDYQMAANTDMNVASSPEVVTERLKKQFGEQVDFELVWVGPYGYRSQMLNDFQYGRVFFVGDVAHVMSPFGARGGNSAIQDADNLGWKLAAVLHGAASPDFLRSYSAERVHAARENIEVTRRTMRFLAAKVGVETTMRNAVLALARQHPFARAYVNTGRMSVATTYLSAEQQGGRHVQNVGVEHSGQAKSILDIARLSGAGVLLFAWGEACTELQSCLAILPAALKAQAFSVHGRALPNELKTDLHDAAGLLAAQCGINLEQGGFALVRPDLYCFGTAPASQACALVQRFLEALHDDRS